MSTDNLDDFFNQWLGQTPGNYIADHGGQVPALEEVLDDLTARRPRRDVLLVFAADGLRELLLDWAAEHVRPGAG